jgi:hypothetical protein
LALRLLVLVAAATLSESDADELTEVGGVCSGGFESEGVDCLVLRLEELLEDSLLRLEDDFFLEDDDTEELEEGLARSRLLLCLLLLMLRESLSLLEEDTEEDRLEDFLSEDEEDRWREERSLLWL